MGTEATPLAEEPTTPRPGIRPAKVAGWALLCAIALAPVVARSGYLSSMGCQIATSAIIVVGLGLLMGYAGQISLGHAAFYAIGAYSSAILTTKAGVHPLLALCAGAAASALLALIVGTPALRLHGHYLAMFTLGLGIIVQIAIEQGKRLTNGFDGITGIPALDLGFICLDSDPRMYGATVVALVGCVLAARNLVDSRPGRAL
ncbi:MAG TPA: branched-chain amino acid ABC transporter permease, partial [Armatimonadota bacterium]|nr:branched-chain amino acid ABC transporter permease [Armatimonadota bacterium]